MRSPFNWVHVSTSDGQNSEPFKVKGFNFTEGYIVQDSTKYKMITVLPFQIFNPLCQVKWTFYGKSVQHLNPTAEFHATHDDKEYYVADKRTRFSKVKFDNKPKNATINGNDTIPSSDASDAAFKTTINNSLCNGLSSGYNRFSKN
uniref:Uncharacterized protein n=1 Tax=Panagrolaimus sp. PS1159 TaxID=55785 RepID=A0AC35F631_9BILA